MDKILRAFLLLYKKRKVTCNEIAEACECSTRTAMRIVDSLSLCVPLTTQRGARGGGNPFRRL